MMLVVVLWTIVVVVALLVSEGRRTIRALLLGGDKTVCPRGKAKCQGHNEKKSEGHHGKLCTTVRTGGGYVKR